MSKIFKKIAQAVEDGELEDVVELTKEALDDEEDPQDIMNKGLIAGMNVVGELFKDGTMFVPDVLVAAKAMDAGMDVLKPFLSAEAMKKVGKIVICTVLGDLHDIGKKLCVMMLEGAGYEVVDLGVDVSVDQMIAAVKEHKPDLMGMAAMLTTTLTPMDEAAEAFKKAGLTDVKLMIGGAPVSTAYAGKIGANYSEDAIACVALANSLMGI